MSSIPEAYISGEPYRGFLPKFFAFICPHCNFWKAYPACLGTIRGIKCAGGAGVLQPVCGKFTSEETIITAKFLRMVEE
jgi:hypothetical protein